MDRKGLFSPLSIRVQLSALQRVADTDAPTVDFCFRPEAALRERPLLSSPPADPQRFT